MLTTTLLLASLAVPQDRPKQEPVPAYDFVVGVAGNEIVLRADLGIQILQDRNLRERFQRATTLEEQNEVQFDALSSRLEDLIMVQAGADLGFDPALVAQLTEREFEQQIERAGGHRAMSESFAQRSLTPDLLKVQIRDRLLAESWRRSHLGRAPGATGRISVDRNIRPGLMRMYYDAFIDSPVRAEREAVGQVEAQVRAQLLQVNVVAGGSKEQARANIEVLIDTYRAGDASFSLLVNQYGDESSRNQRGIGPPSALAQLGQLRHASVDLGRLVNGGEVGEVTPPLWLEVTGRAGEIRTQAWCVYRLAERIPPVPPLPFESRELQADLRAYLLEVLDEQREEVAFTAALHDTHVWPEEHRAVILESRMKKRVN
jgi:hypothetical protein